MVFKCRTCRYQNSNKEVVRRHEKARHDVSLSKPRDRSRSPIRTSSNNTKSAFSPYRRRLTTPDFTIRRPTRPILPGLHRARPLPSLTPTPSLISPIKDTIPMDIDDCNTRAPSPENQPPTSPLPETPSLTKDTQQPPASPLSETPSLAEGTQPPPLPETPSLAEDTQPPPASPLPEIQPHHDDDGISINANPVDGWTFLSGDGLST
ncbi:putative uncharacterized protein ENSP00000383309 [Strongylocentrotus purpuratus]|uniref:Uncharacterized protein n=1 Tax=Strongylocentrotus purpuratus TaxID=7668 RepID=A0A7M7NPV3_STRPU|nr:putative uncharacterized protein ENSP00000383309 [Strongylocentrotus purpuratus]